MSINRDDSTLLMSRRAVFLYALLSGIIILLSMNMKLGVYDESIILVGAMEIINRNIPHKDFYFNYGPAQIVLLAGIFSVFGKSLIVARLYDAAVRIGIVIICGYLLRALRVELRIASIALILQIFLLISAGPYLYVIFPSLLLSLAGTLILSTSASDGRGSEGRLLAGGAITGMISLFRYDVGFFVMVAHALGLALLCGEPERLRSTGRVLGLYVAGISLIFLPFAVAALAAGAGPSFVHDIIRYPAQYYAAMRGLPFPTPALSGSFGLSLAVYAPVPTSMIAAWFLLDRSRHEGKAAVQSPKMRLLLLLAALTVALFAKGFVRVSLTHMLMAVIAAVPVLAVLSTRCKPRWAAHGAMILAVMITVSAVAALGLKGREDFNAPENLLPLRLAGTTPFAMQRPCVALGTLGLGTLDADSYGAACYLSTQSARGELIFVGAGRHDKLFISNMALYFAADRLPASRWYHFDPGLQTREDVQLSIIAELEKVRVRLVARDAGYDAIEEPNQSSVSSGVHLLDEYLDAKYSPVARFGQITVYRRNST
jgi:hypothetical protein